MAEITVKVSPEAYKLGNERNKGYSKFEFLFLKILQAHCSNPEFAKALPQAICNIALQTTEQALEIMSARRTDPFVEFSEPGLKQSKIPFNYSNTDSSAKICDCCKKPYGRHSAASGFCPAVDRDGNIIQGFFRETTFRTVEEIF